MKRVKYKNVSVMLLLWLTALSLSAQGVRPEEQRVTLDLPGTTAVQLFKAIHNQTGLHFIVNAKDLQGVGEFSVKADNEPVKPLLERLFQNKAIDFKFSENTIIVSPSKDKFHIAGQITDALTGETLIGASVQITDTTLGTATDLDGRFELLCPGEKATLTFSYVGYKTQRITIKRGDDDLHVKLESSGDMEEVIVTGMFTRRANSFTGAVQTFNKDELRKVGNTNVLQSIKNLDPSFRIAESMANGSDPNQTYDITLRGQSGFPDLRGEYTSNPNNPLFIVDGFEQSVTYVMDMDMNRIASVTLLKDAAAKAIYGSKAANGVVVIETILPEKGKLRVSYTGNMNVQLPDLTSYDLCNAKEKLQVEHNAGMYTYFYDNGADIHVDPSSQYAFDQVYNNYLKEVTAGVDTDWKAIPLRNGIGQKHTIYLEGGDDYFRYGLDATVNNVEGVMKGSTRNTYMGGVTLSYRYKNLMLKNNLSVTYNKAEDSPYGSFSEYTRMNPYYRCWDENGNVIKVPGESYEILYSGRGNVYNPAWNATINTRDFSEYTQLINNFYLEWTPVKNLKLTGRFSLNKTDKGSEVFKPASHTDFVGWENDPEKIYRRGSYSYGDGKALSFSSDILANYSVLLDEKHLIFANAGWSLNNSTSESASFMAEGFPNDKLDNLAFARQYYKDGRPSSYESTTRDVGFVGAMNYSYDDRYLFDASFRLSASSQFGADNRWGNFWSLGIGWNLHKEKFMENLIDNGILSQLKIRGSLGYTGSQNFSSYQSIATYQYSTSTAYNGNIGALLSAMPNERLKWQRRYDRGFGIDVGLFNGRLQGRFDYYSAITDDLLTEVTLPSSTGFKSYKENLGKVENKGYEISLKYRVWNNPSKNAFFNVFAAASHNENRVKKISNYLQTYNDAQNTGSSNKPITRYEEGQSMTAIWAVKSMGIDPACGDELFLTPDGRRTYNWSSSYLQICGDTEPDLYGNLGFNLDYMGFSLNVTTRYQFGGQVYNQTLVDKVENADLDYNVDRRIFTDRWVKPGDVSLYKNIKNEEITRATSRFVEDDDQFIISALNLSYDFGRLAAVKNTGLERVKLSFDMADVARFQSVKVERGTSYPFARTFSFSLQVMF